MKCLTSSLTVVLVCGLALFAFGPAEAAGSPSGPTPDTSLSPYFLVESGDPSVDRLPLKATNVEVKVAGVIADVVVTQVYSNEGERPLNALYLFPASTRAAVQGLSMQVGSRVVRAKIRERERAKREFVRAQAAGKSAALLEQQRPNVFSMRVANVLPHEEIRVELRYSELLVPTGGVYELVYPTVVGPRYSKVPERPAGTKEAAAPAASPGTIRVPTLRAEAEPPSRFDISVRIAAGLPISDLASPSHKTTVAWEGLTTAGVFLDGTDPRSGDRDFILHYRLQGERVQTGMLLYAPDASAKGEAKGAPAPGDGEKFFLLMMQPPRRVAPAQVPPREYVFVLDVSGSMYGFPMETAKTLMRELVLGLRPTDRFNVVLFAGGSRLLAPKSLAATPANLEWAIAEIGGEQGSGGTELDLALTRALELPGNQGISRTTIVITDGFIDAEAEVFERIRKNLGRTNFFAFGIGSSVNRHLIEGMARAGQGEPFVVTAPEEAAEAARRFREYVTSPVLTDIKFERNGFDAYDVEPLSVPDLFADRPLILFGKWRGEATGSLRVTGVGGDGPYEQTIDLASADLSPENKPLRALWARERVRTLADYGFGIDDATRKEIVRLGLTYELLTAYTSFIAVHETVRTSDPSAQTAAQPQPLPQGVSENAVGNEVPEPEIGLLLLLGLAFALRSALRRRRQGADVGAEMEADEGRMGSRR